MNMTTDKPAFVSMPEITYIKFGFNKGRQYLTKQVTIDHRIGETYKDAEKKMRELFPNVAFEFISMYESHHNFKKSIL